MRTLKISVSKILGTCTADPPLVKGEAFYIRQGDIFIPGGGSVCLWALQSLLPLVPAKERKISEQKSQDWMWRVHHVQCPDPDGQVIFRIDRLPDSFAFAGPDPELKRDCHRADLPAAAPIRDLRICVDEIRGHCTSRWKRGNAFELRSGRLYIPSGGFLCLYALQSVLPFLAAKQRRLEDGDWLKTADRFLCPDPAGNVILRVAPADSGQGPGLAQGSFSAVLARSKKPRASGEPKALPPAEIPVRPKRIASGAAFFGKSHRPG